MIKALEGPVGSCKTFLMTQLAYKRWKKGVHIRSVYALTFETSKKITVHNVSYFDNPIELRRAHDCVILIDEGAMIENRSWQDLPKCFYDMLQQHRHRRLEIYITTQAVAGLDVKVRRLLDETIYCWAFPVRLPFSHHKKAWLQLSFMSRFPFFLLIGFWSKELYNTFGDTGLSITRVGFTIHDRKLSMNINNTE